jgi:chemotaxis protein MotB
MSDEQQPEIIIVRRRVEGEEGHHGGAWKIAYADFVTAMMAFFLVLWILSSTNKDSQTIIARYFNPVKMEDFAKNKKGIREAQQREDKPGSNEGDPELSPPNGQDRSKIEEKGKDPSRDPNAKSLMNEETLFKNPYAALEQIAGKVADAPDQKAAGAPAEAGSQDVFRDPFRSSGAESADEPDEAPPAASKHSAAALKSEESQSKAAEQAPKAQEAASGKMETAASAASVKAAAEAAENARATTLQKEIGKALKGEGGEGEPRIDVKATDEGLLISLTDSENFGMFEIGSSSPNPKMVRLMDRIAQSLKDQPGALVLRGYTDSRRYRNGASDNWRLSASRAQMALYMLVRGGLPEARVQRVEGYADRKPKAPDKPEAAENRRIEILLRKAAP